MVCIGLWYSSFDRWSVRVRGVLMSSIKDLSYDHQQAIEAMKSQLIIVLVNRLGGEINIPVSEIDGTGKYNLAMKIDPDKSEFTFTVMNKK